MCDASRIENSPRSITSLVMSLSSLRKVPRRLLDSVSSWRQRRARSSSRGPGGEGGAARGRQRRRHNSEQSNSLCAGSALSGRNGVEEDGCEDEDDIAATDEPLLTERDHKELMSLLNQNISMDFILEMKEAFQLFDKVGSTVQHAFLSRQATAEALLHYLVTSTSTYSTLCRWTSSIEGYLSSCYKGFIV